MIYKPIHNLGRAINTLLHGLGSHNRQRAWRHAALLLLGIWATFLPVLGLAWFAVLRRTEFPSAILLQSLADSVLFVFCCYLGVRLRQSLPVPWLRRLLVVLVVLMFLPIVAIVWIQHLASVDGQSSAVTMEMLEFYYGWVFDIYVFSLMGLLSGLNGYNDGEPGGRMHWTGALPRPAPALAAAQPPETNETKV